jgi:hypothetical protein
MGALHLQETSAKAAEEHTVHCFDVHGCGRAGWNCHRGTRCPAQDAPYPGPGSTGLSSPADDVAVVSCMHAGLCE